MVDTTGTLIDMETRNTYDYVSDVVDLLNEQENIIHQLTLRINEIATKYRLLKEFSKDTDPNEAVNHIIRELMMNTKELRR